MGIVSAVVIIILVAADQYTKHIAAVSLKPVETIPVVEGFFSFTYVENTGAAFGILEGKRWFFVILTVIILFAMLFYYRAMPKEKQYIHVKTALILISAGAIGNFIDRLRNGFVVDFLHVTFIEFPVFNIADCFVCIGAFYIAFMYIFIIKEE